MAELAAPASLEIGFQLGKSVRDPVPVPVVDLLLRLPERALQMLQHAQVVQRMDLARDQIGDGTHPRARERFLRNERWRRVLFVQPLDDGERLDEARAVVEFERRQERLRVYLGVPAFAVLPLRQVHEHRLVGDAFKVERDANAKGRGAAKVGVKLHNAGAIFTLSSLTPSMPASSSSPGFTGPTPAGVPVKMMSPGSSV